MCGIAGTYIQSSNLSMLENNMDLSPIFNRGPDAQNVYSDDDCILGAARLNILDPLGGKQPFIVDNRFILVFNGQIYNHLTLRKKLENFKWTTHSDTETVIQLLIRFGPKILDDLQGMFALAFYDVLKKQLIVARDKAGEKPLFYYQNPNKMTFGSTIDVICKNLSFELDLDFDAVQKMLAIGFVPPNTSVYSAIKPILPGSYLQINKNSVDVISYRKKLPQRNIDDRSGKFLSNLIQESVDAQCTADVDVGLFLSGGLDSSMLAHSMKQRLGDFKSFCVDFGTNKNDIESAVKIARELSTKLIIVKINNDINQLVEINANFFDEPFGDSANIPLNAMSFVAKNEVGVCLSGDGADELFGGYDFRYQPLISKPLPNNFFVDNLMINSSLSLMSKIGLRKLKQAYHFKKMAQKYKTQDDKVKFFLESNYNLASKHGELHGLNHELFTNRDQNIELINSILLFEQNFYLVGDILVKTDRATMGHSLEARTPYLSSKIIEFANALSPEDKVSKKGMKLALRKAFEYKTGTPYLRTDKQGMGLPVKYWMQTNQIQKKLLYLKQKKFYKEVCGNIGQGYIEKSSMLSHQFNWNLFNLLSWAEAKGRNG